MQSSKGRSSDKMTSMFEISGKISFDHFMTYSSNWERQLSLTFSCIWSRRASRFEKSAVPVAFCKWATQRLKKRARAFFLAAWEVRRTRSMRSTRSRRTKRATPPQRKTGDKPNMPKYYSCNYRSGDRESSATSSDIWMASRKPRKETLSRGRRWACTSPVDVATVILCGRCNALSVEVLRSLLELKRH